MLRRVVNPTEPGIQPQEDRKTNHYGIGEVLARSSRAPKTSGIENRLRHSPNIAFRPELAKLFWRENLSSHLQRYRGQQN